MIPIIIAGGAGSRLWPVSRQDDPKPFIKVSDGLSLLQSTFLRAINLPNVTRVVTVTSEKIFFRIQDEYQQINKNIKCDFILEPFGRNTAAAILSACLWIKKQYGDNQNVIILPADHLVVNNKQFQLTVNDALKIISQGYLVTFGIEPTYPETGYGYIEKDSNKKIESGYLVKRFVEKPTITVANQYINSHNYLWNSGMFFGKIADFLSEFELYAKSLTKNVTFCLQESLIDKYKSHTTILHLDTTTFENVENISIDYALFEKTNKLAVIPCNMGWSDIGSWFSISEVLPKDKNNNVLVGENIIHNTYDCLVYSINTMVATVDVKDLIIVVTNDAVLVADKNNSQNVKYVFEKLKSIKHHTSEVHQTIHHIWGTTTLLESTHECKIYRVNLSNESEIQISDTNYDAYVLKHNSTPHYLLVLNGELVIQKYMNNILHHEIIINSGESYQLTHEDQYSYKLLNKKIDNVIFLHTINFTI